ncbi:MAG TPA: YciI family protein [Kofleriaceae bacterium]|nr:YciI family protein [Kofleriaceae bacterium]
MAELTCMLLFRDEGIDWVKYAPDGACGKAYFQKFVDWAEDLERRGKLVAVDSLERGGKTVRRKGASIVVDGPYAEGREAVLGYYMVRVADLEEALALAAEAPHTEAGGATEVRVVGAFPKPR